MAVKKFNPTTPSRREMTMSTFDEITTNVPEKSLLVSLTKTGGRNAQGKITVRHHGGGAKRKYASRWERRSERILVQKNGKSTH